MLRHIKKWRNIFLPFICFLLLFIYRRRFAGESENGKFLFQVHHTSSLPIRKKKDPTVSIFVKHSKIDSFMSLKTTNSTINVVSQCVKETLNETTILLFCTVVVWQLKKDRVPTIKVKKNNNRRLHLHCYNNIGTRRHTVHRKIKKCREGFFFMLIHQDGMDPHYIDGCNKNEVSRTRQKGERE